MYVYVNWTSDVTTYIQSLGKGEAVQVSVKHMVKHNYGETLFICSTTEWLQTIQGIEISMQNVFAGNYFTNLVVIACSIPLGIQVHCLCI